MNIWGYIYNVFSVGCFTMEKRQNIISSLKRNLYSECHWIAGLVLHLSSSRAYLWVYAILVWSVESLQKTSKLLLSIYYFSGLLRTHTHTLLREKMQSIATHLWHCENYFCLQHIRGPSFPTPETHPDKSWRFGITTANCFPYHFKNFHIHILRIIYMPKR